MKKIYALVAGLVLTGAVNAQSITLAGHTAGAFAFDQTHTVPGLASLTDGGSPASYLGGTGSTDVTQGGQTYTLNNFGLVQIFDENDGVVAGTVTGVSFLASKVVDGGNSSKVRVSINTVETVTQGGESFIVKGAELAFTEVPLSSISTATSGAGFATVTYNGAIAGATNNSFTFTTPATIPASKKVMAFISIPQGAGDTLAIYTTVNSDMGALPPTMVDWKYTGSNSGDYYGYQSIAQGSFQSYADSWSAEVANLLYATILPETTSTTTLAGKVVTVYPNPANEVLNFSIEGVSVNNVDIYSLDGKKVLSNEFNGVSNGSVNVSGLVNGAYIYELSTSQGAVRANFIKR